LAQCLEHYKPAIKQKEKTANIISAKQPTLQEKLNAAKEVAWQTDAQRNSNDSKTKTGREGVR